MYFSCISSFPLIIFFFNKDFLSTQYLFLWLWCKQLNPALFVLCKWLEWPAECSALPTHRILLKKGYPSAFDQLIALIRLSEIQVLSKRKSHLSVALCRAGGWNYFCFPGAREGCKGFTQSLWFWAAPPCLAGSGQLQPQGSGKCGVCKQSVSGCQSCRDLLLIAKIQLPKRLMEQRSCAERSSAAAPAERRILCETAELKHFKMSRQDDKPQAELSLQR